MKKRRNDFLKLLAICIMIYDHAMAVLYPDMIELRIVGRTGYPLFAFAIAEGYYYTSNLENYLKRILILGLVSQPFYILLFETYRLNILFSFFISLLLLKLLNNKKIKYRYLFFILLFPLLHFCGYGIYGFFVILFYSLFRNKKAELFSLQGALMMITATITKNKLILINFIGVLMTTFWRDPKFKIHVGKYFFYWFYPAHLAILYLLKIYIS